MAKADLFDRTAALDEASVGLRDRLIAWRHHLHANPELSNREERTGAFIAGRLREAGLDVDALPVGESLVTSLRIHVHVTADHLAGAAGPGLAP
jgi:metal-dependent amidase/aminoacylase/carboxypeptidase family protein